MTDTTPARALQRILFRVEYDGTSLVGWQRQDNGPSVQAILEQAAEKLTTQPTPVQGSGRTDAGVHATGQAAHLDVPTYLTATDVMRGLNALLETHQVSVVSPPQPYAEMQSGITVQNWRLLRCMKLHRP